VGDLIDMFCNIRLLVAQTVVVGSHVLAIRSGDSPDDGNMLKRRRRGTIDVDRGLPVVAGEMGGRAINAHIGRSVGSHFGQASDSGPRGLPHVPTELGARSSVRAAHDQPVAGGLPRVLAELEVGSFVRAVHDHVHGVSIAGGLPSVRKWLEVGSEDEDEPSEPLLQLPNLQSAQMVCARVAEFVRHGCPLVLGWMSGVSAVVGNAMSAFECTVFTDCDGIGAPIEALRIMKLSGMLGNYDHIAGCEVDPHARAFSVQHHGPPTMFMRDITSRDWQAIPRSADIYVCGCPCTPFTSRRTSHTTLFEEDEACCGLMLSCGCSHHCGGIRIGVVVGDGRRCVVVVVVVVVVVIQLARNKDFPRTST
jgi:hypothetical protein